jgi:hypothetical protein
MGTKDKERRVYPADFKAEAVALAEKRGKPIRQAAAIWALTRICAAGGYSGLGKREAQAHRLSPDTDGRRTSRTLVRACPPAEGSQDPEGGGVKPRFT